MASCVKTVLTHPLTYILLLAAALRGSALGSFRCSDDLAYVSSAADLVHGAYSPGGFHTFRFGMLFPLAGLFSLFGVHYLSAAVWPLGTSLGTVALAYVLGRDLADRRTGLLAALLTAVTTQHALSSAEIFPDMPLALFTAAACLLHLRAPGARRAGLLYFAAGALLGFAFLVKIEVLKIVPFLIAWEAVRAARGTWSRRVAWEAAGFALLLAIDAVLLHFFTGDAWRRWDEFRHGSLGWSAAMMYFPGGGEHGLWPMVKSLASPWGAFGIFFWLAPLGTWRAWRTRTILFATLWLWTGLAVTLALAYTQHLSEGRHYTFLAVPAAVVGAYGVTDMLRNRPRAAAVATVAGLAVIGLVLTHTRLQPDTIAVKSAAAEAIRREPGPLYADDRNRLLLRSLFDLEDREMRDAVSEPVPSGALVLVDEEVLRFRETFYGHAIPDALKHPPAAWRPLYAGRSRPGGLPPFRAIAAWLIRLKWGADWDTLPPDVSVYRVP